MNQNDSKKFVNQTEPMECSLSHNVSNNPMEQGVRWTEKYSKEIEKWWTAMPNWMGQALVTIAVFLLASGIHGMNMDVT